MLRIKTFGNRNPLSGLSQIEGGFVSLGHVIVDDNPDIIYHANGYFDDLLEYARNYPNATKIGCLLDADPLNPNWGPPEIVEDQLLQLDIPVTISYTAQQQILKRTNVKCAVVYYPIKRVECLDYPVRGVRMLVVGRIYSKNKRLQLIKDVAEKYCGDYEQVLFVGPEKPPFGIYAGLATEEMLNVYYNSSVFLLALSSTEGLYLPMLESAVAKTIPILTLDNSCVREFGLQKFAADPNPKDIVDKMNHIERHFKEYSREITLLGVGFKERFSGKAVAKNILALYHDHKKDKNL